MQSVRERITCVAEVRVAYKQGGFLRDHLPDLERARSHRSAFSEARIIVARAQHRHVVIGHQIDERRPAFFQVQHDGPRIGSFYFFYYIEILRLEMSDGRILRPLYRILDVFRIEGASAMEEDSGTQLERPFFFRRRFPRKRPARERAHL